MPSMESVTYPSRKAETWKRFPAAATKAQGQGRRLQAETLELGAAALTSREPAQ